MQWNSWWYLLYRWQSVKFFLSDIFAPLTSSLLIKLHSLGYLKKNLAKQDCTFKVMSLVHKFIEEKNFLKNASMFLILLCVNRTNKLIQQTWFYIGLNLNHPRSATIQKIRLKYNFILAILQTFSLKTVFLKNSSMD